MSIKIKENQVPRKDKYGQTIKSDQYIGGVKKEQQNNNFEDFFKESCKKFPTNI